MPSALIAGARYLHVSGISQAISANACDSVFSATGMARQGGAKVSYDSNLRVKLWPVACAHAIIRQTVGLCDLFLPSLDDAQQFTGLSDPDSTGAGACFAGAAGGR